MIDVTGPTWLALKERLSKEVEDSRTGLEQVGLSEKQRDYECGYIAALRFVLKLPEEGKS